MSWKYFNGNCNQDDPQGITDPPECPPWREFLPREAVDAERDTKYWEDLQNLAKENHRAIQRGKSFRVQTDKNGYCEIVEAVNAAIHLRRPLLVTGVAGSGKTSLAYAIAFELQLGPVLTWPITARANLIDAEYRYDAIARLQDAQLAQTLKEGDNNKYTPEKHITLQNRLQDLQPARTRKIDDDLGNYIQLGPVGTAFLPSLRPRVLLIDEIDKSDLNLPNDLLNLFEEGEFEIPELVRRKRRREAPDTPDATVTVRTADRDLEAPITNGRVKCCEFPIVIMTSNGERDFPPAFNRRCLRVKMPDPTPESLVPIVEAHFNNTDLSSWTNTQNKLTDLIKDFLDKGNKADRATDQLLNAIYLINRAESLNEEEMKRLQNLLFRRLSEVN